MRDMVPVLQVVTPFSGKMFPTASNTVSGSVSGKSLTLQLLSVAKTSYFSNSYTFSKKKEKATVFLTEEQCAAMLAMNRQELIDFLCKTGYIAALPEKQQGIYLFGRTKNERAVCLAWGDNNDGCITLDAYRGAYREIVGTGLKVPFLFFGRTSLCTQSDIFTFAQLPWCFEHQSNPVLNMLRDMNLRANLHAPTQRRGEGITSSEAERLVGYAINAVLQSL